MDENEDKAWWRPESSHGYVHLLSASRSQWYMCAALCVTLTLSLSLLILMPSRLGCPDGWNLHNSSCYFFSAYRASWYTARDSCRSMDATLLILTDEEEWVFVNRMSASRIFWLGLSDERTGEWEWVNGSPYIMDQSKWMPGQPDNWTGHSIGGTEDCAHITTSGKLNDNHCTVAYTFICKARPAPN
ncbi:C-type lectin domain family 10 member A-like isoform X3 [Salvelinus namaycush]|uniref:C-type lectin domain family 10 member A-like isoform X3 n=1 Tax=Salvelinus namaycush TaxID=8040 RepID=A0A8U0QMV0_SALNM|nr:C-type lectin domain family 10 member A-like isoform X3 [Salvelinus namaycush]